MYCLYLAMCAVTIAQLAFIVYFHIRHEPVPALIDWHGRTTIQLDPTEWTCIQGTDKDCVFWEKAWR